MKYFAKSKFIGLIFGVVAFITVQILNIIPNNPAANSLLAAAIMMAAFWISEAIPLGATSLIPIFLFPILEIISPKEVASEYINSIIFLFLGGFLIAIAMEKWNLHKRISLKILTIIGTSPARLIAGFMIACAFMSMFISNTATVLMMLPIGIAVISKMEEFTSQKQIKKFSIALMLGIAYACSIGGITTLIGTAPNLVFRRIYEMNFPQAAEISFGNWMFFALPITILMLVIVWFILNKVLFKIRNKIDFDKQFIVEQYKQLGKITYEEKVVLIVFIITGLLWIFRNDIQLGIIDISGWTTLLNISEHVNDTSIAIAMAFVLFIIPSKQKKRTGILTAGSFKKVPWEIMLLFGGGFALAKAFQTTGLSEIIGSSLSSLAAIHPLFILLFICAAITFLTEITSNTATAQTLLPILASLSIAIDVNPLFIMVPATISASFAFMLPVATPPNAIVFASGRIKISDMARTGLLINIIGILLISIYSYFFVEDLLN